MDATYSNYRKRLLPALLTLSVGLAVGALAERSQAANPGSSTAIIVTDSKPVSESSPSISARGTVAFVAPSKRAPRVVSKPKPLARKPEPSPRSARGDVVIVSQRQLMPTVRRSRSAPRTPTAPPIVQVAVALPLVKSVRPAPVQIVQHQEEIESPDPIGKLLLKAHAISLQAATEADYSQIVKHSSSALRQGAQKEERRFARQLISWALNRRGQMRIDEGQQELADADFREALENNSNNWRALHNRGVSYAQQGDFAEAFDDFNLVIQLNPKHARAFVNRATLFMQANDMQSALADYQIAAEIDPDFSRAQLGIGRVHQVLGQRDEAIVFFDAAVQFDANNAETLCSRGDLLADMGQYGKALADYARAIKVDPEYAHAYRNGSWLLATCPEAQFRDPQNALQGARQALDFNYGQRHVALDTLAAALASAGQYDEAINTLQNALALAPTKSKSAYTQRLRLYYQQQPFRTEPVGDISQVVFEVTDQ